MSEYALYILALYFFTLFSVFIARFVDIKIGNILALAIALIAFGVAAFRPEYYPDVDTYELLFKYSASGDFNDPLYWLSHGEPGFKLLSYLISFLGFNYSGLLIIMAYFSFILLIYISRLSGVYFVYLWFAYFSFAFILRDLGVIRLGIASHLIVIFYLQRAIIWQIVTLMIATFSFQYFAFVAAFAKLLTRFNINWRSLSTLFLITFLTARFLSFENLQFFLPEDGVNTINNAREGANSAQFSAGGQAIILPVIRNLFIAFFLYFFLRNESRFQDYRLMIWSAFLSGAVYIMASDILVVAQRFSAYFAAVVPVLMAFLMQRQSMRNDTFFLTVLVCLLNFASIFYFYGPGFRFF